MAMTWVKRLWKSLLINSEAIRHFSFAETAVLKIFVKSPGKHLYGVFVLGKMQATTKKDLPWVISDKSFEISKGSLEVYPGLMHTSKISNLQQQLTTCRLNYCFTALQLRCLQKSWIRLCRIPENTSVIKQKGESQNCG